MTGHEALMRGLYATPLITLVDQLPAIADRQCAQLHELHWAPTAERCERMAAELEGVRRHLMMLRQALQDDGASRSPIG